MENVIKKKMRADFDKNYPEICVEHLDAADRNLVKELAYTMYLHGSMYTICEADLLDHPII